MHNEQESHSTRLKNNVLNSTVSKATRAAMPGIGLYDQHEPQTHTVSINGVTYEWTDATADSVPEEARAIYERSLEANT